MQEKRILILGGKGFPKVYCYEWNDPNFPNIPDYDVVIIDVVSLTRSKLKEDIQPNIRQGLKTLLNSEGHLLAIGCPLTRIDTILFSGGKELISSQNNYEWCPIPIKIINSSGTSFKFHDDIFIEYFEKVKKWSYFFEIPDIWTQDINIGIENYVVNRYGKYIAGRIYFSGYLMKFGDFVFLPCPTEISNVEAINFILEKFLNVFQKTPPPEWTKSIQVPGLEEIEKKISKNEQIIGELSKDIEELENEKSELIEFRELLYESGVALEEVVRKVFTKLGYEPKPPMFKEEYVIEFDNNIGIIECKGNEKSIKRDDFRQLLEHTKEYELNAKVEHKGILVGNAWRSLPIQERNKNETPIFPKGKDGVTDIATRHYIALVSTVDLFNVFCKYLEGKIKAEDIMKKIFSAKGQVNFDF